MVCRSQVGYMGHLSTLLNGEYQPDWSMALLGAYFDKSGDVDKPVIAVAGFIATAKQWDRLKKPWIQTMRDYHVKDFHMSDLMTGYKEFASPWWLSQQRPFMNRLISIIIEHMRARAGAAVVLDAFKQAQLGETKKWVGSPYRLCCSDSMIGACVWASQSPRRGHVDFVFDRDGKFYNETNKLYRMLSEIPRIRDKFRIGSIGFSNRKEAVGLQAGEMLAYLMFDYLRRKVGDPNALPHPYLVALHEVKEETVGHLFQNPQAIEDWAKLMSDNFDKPHYLNLQSAIKREDASLFC